MVERTTVDSDRVRIVRRGEQGKGPVVYWMSRDQRAHDNWALLHAQEQALVRGRPLVVVFCLDVRYPAANLRHFGFLLRSLELVRQDLKEYAIPLVLLQGTPDTSLPAFLNDADAALLVTDFDPLRIKRLWKAQVARACRSSIHEVDAHNIVPCWLVSDKREYAAYTIRPKLRVHLPQFLTDFPKLRTHPYRGDTRSSVAIEVEELLAAIPDTRVPEITWLEPGEKAAGKLLASFLAERLDAYENERNDPCVQGQSDLSPYFHFGQLSPQRVAWEVQQSNGAQGSKEAYLEELIVRRELSDNYCWYEEAYDDFKAFPDWAKKSLDEHRKDVRPHRADSSTMEQGETGEELWNACQRDLVNRGKLHGYLRMYWAKKILEWSSSPEEAMETCIRLNDRYSLDGRDPNGYAGIAWSIGGVHDRAWAERPIFGKVRYMNAAGLRRKFAIDEYVRRVSILSG